MKTSLFMPLVALLLVSCAKEKEYETVYEKSQDTHLVKSDVESMCTIDDPCLYLPSVANTPYHVTASRPYWQGDAKLVVSQVTEERLNFLEIEADERYQENTNNQSPVMSIEVEHKSYKCKEDAYGECTNVEEENEENNWDDRPYIQMDLAKLNIIEMNSLPIQFSNLFTSGCFKKLSQEVIDRTIEKDAMNFTVKRTYTTNAGCEDASFIQSREDLRYLNFSVEYKYSIVKLSKLIDPSYKVANYPVTEHSRYGFFKTTKQKKSIDHHNTHMGTKEYLMNRWSPNKKTIKYYLSKAYFEKENKSILAATYKAIDSVNSSLAQANTGMSIELADGRGKDEGDLRNNFLVLVTDPQASGVVGYGPSITNPKTGEIVNAKTIMYLGTIQKFVASAYDELIEKKNGLQSEESEGVETENAQNAAKETSITTEKLSSIPNDIKMSPKLRSMIENADFSNTQLNTIGHSFNETPSIEKFDMSVFRKEKSKFEKMYDEMAQNNVYHADFIDFQNVIDFDAILKITNNELRMWDNLNEEQREKIIAIILPKVYIPTLVHEFGHNLGLRHNFAGSTDKVNFYKKEETNLDREISYSSIMDYAHNNYNELSIMGKYDKAALRFAYAREIELKNGTVAKVVNDPSKKNKTQYLNDDESVASEVNFKNYKFCTDENVNRSLICNRFDKGTNFSEIAQHYIDSHNDNYDKRNLRGRRYDFNSSSGDFNYAVGIMNRFMNLRMFFETFSDLVQSGQYKEGWEKDENLVDIKKASDKVFNFFADILKTPAYSCLEIDKKTSQIERVASFKEMARGTQLEEFGINFDIRFGCLYLNQYGNQEKMYFEFGKYFNNALDLSIAIDEKKQFDSSQIDVRGIWSEKVMAMSFLTERYSSPSNTSGTQEKNFLDYPEYKAKYETFIKSMIDNTLTQDIIATAPDGNRYTIKDVNIDLKGSHSINRSYSGSMNWFFGLNKSINNFEEIAFEMTKKNLREKVDRFDFNQIELLNNFSLTELPIFANNSQFDFEKIVTFKNPEGKIIKKYGITDKNTYALHLANIKEKIDFLDITAPQSLVYLFQNYDSLPEELPANIDAIIVGLKDKVTQEELYKYLTGELSTESIFKTMYALSK